MAVKRRGLPGFDKDSQEQAWRAVQALRGMMPQLDHFARIASGNSKVKVAVTTDAPHTRGNTIFVRPPLGLGAKMDHTRSRCGSRDANGWQICKACGIREVIDFYLFHEIAHVIGDTQARAISASFDLARNYLNIYHHHSCDHYYGLTQKIRYAENFGIDSMNLLNILNSYLPMIFNVLDDCRVNEMTFRARPGMRKIFDVNMERLLTEGSEVGIDRYLSWADAPLDSQFMIGLQMVAAQYDCIGTLHESVQEALQDQRLITLCRRALHTESAHGTYSLSLEVFDRAQELGFCLVEKCKPPVEPEPRGDDQDGLAEDSGGSDSAGEAGDTSDPGGEGTSPGVSEGGSESGEDSGGESPSNSGEGEAESENDGTAGSPESGSGSDETSGRPGSDDSESSGDSGGTSGAGSSSEDSTGGGSADESSDQGGSSGSPNADAGPAGEGSVDGAEDSSSESDEAVQSEVDRDGDAGSEGRGSPSADRNGEADNQSDSSDAAGISGIGSEGAATQNLGEQEGSSRESRLEQVGDDDSGFSSESQSGSDGVDGTDHDDSGEDSGEPSDEDAEERPEAEAESVDYPLDLSNPWDIDNPDENLFDYVDSLEPSEYVPDNTPTTTTGDVPPDIERGTIDDIERDLARFLMHGLNEHDGLLDGMSEEELSKLLGFDEHGSARGYGGGMTELLDLAIKQVEVFDGPSLNVAANEIATFPHWGIKWDADQAAKHYQVRPEDLPKMFAPPESLVGRAVLKGRRVFSDNLKAARDRNRKTGRINTRVLGRRAPVGDPRLFQKRVVPAKRDYFMVLAGDASGSTSQYERCEKIKRSIHAQADLLDRLGIAWAGYMHSAFESPLRPFRPSGTGIYYNYMLPFKEADEAWSEAAKEKLASVLPISQNLDGHSLEFYRKVAMKSTATDRFVVYYTDGRMPAANKEEEKQILLREIDLYKRHGINLVCVGIQTDSPKEYGLPTVQVDSDEDISKVLDFMERLLAK